MPSPSRALSRATQLVVLVVIFVIAAPAALCLGVGLLAPDTHPMHGDRAFERDAWAEFEIDGATGFPSRLPMSASLVAARTLHGMTRAEVEALLGPPDQVTRRGLRRSLEWEVGRANFLASYYSVLTVEFDGDGRVENVQAPGSAAGTAR